jgi:hypothetical protein
MSKKTVTFRMPGKDAPNPRGQGPQEILPPEKPASSGSANSRQSDQWVEHRNTDVAPIFASMPFAGVWPTPPAMRAFMVDVAAPRSLPEVVALSFIVPPMLGWFWLYNAMNRFAGRAGV